MTVTSAPPRPDASLSLLARIVDDSLDPSYAEVARRRSSGHAVQRPPRGRVAVAAVLGLLGVLLASVVTQTWRDQPELERSHAELADRVEAATAAADTRETQVQALDADVERLREAALVGRDDAAALEDRLATLEVAAGVVPLSGPGVRVLVDDGPAHRQNGVGPDLARVLDRDLQLLVNGLLAAGAEAVAVNGQRITTTSAIRSAGDAVLVGYRPLARPYVVTALGDPRTLAARFEESPAGRQLRTLTSTYAMPYEVSTEDVLSLPGEPVTEVRYAHPREH